MEKKISAYQKIYNDIYDQILLGTYKPGDQLPVEMDLCKKYNVSRITIQKALKLLSDKEIITRTIGKGTFVAHPQERHMIKNSLLGVVLCNISASFGTEILKSIEKTASDNGYSIIFKNSNFDRNLEISAIKQLMDLDVAGLILQPTHGEATNPEIMRMILNKKPIVLIDRNLSGLSCSFVGSDNYQATRKVMRTLFADGHRNICFMCSNPSNTTSTLQRLEEFKNSYQENGCEFKDYFIYSDIISTIRQTNIESAKKQDVANIKEYILAHPDITCIFTLEYSICCLVRKALKEVNPDYRNKIAVVTFDYISDPHIVTDTAYVKQYEDEIGLQAVRLLIRKIMGDEEDVRLYLPTELVNADNILKLDEVE